MSALNQRHIRWLHTEIDRWIADGLLTQEQAAAIRGRYPSSAPEIPWGKIIFSGIGAILLGLGVILLFAYNWDGMHRFLKLGIIFGGLFISHGIGYRLRREQGTYWVAGEGFHVLGIMLFGAGIWLIAQIYHIDEHYPNAFLFWGLGALGMAWALPSTAQGIVAAILLTVWHGTEGIGFSHPNGIGLPLIIGGILPLAWLQRSKALMTIGTIAGLTALSFTCGNIAEEIIVPVLFCWACALISLPSNLFATRMEKNGFEDAALPLAGLGWIIYLTLLYILTFPGAENLIGLDTYDEIAMLCFFLSFLVAASLVGRWLYTLLQKKSGQDPKSRSLPEWLSAIGVCAGLGILFLRITVMRNIDDWGGAALFNLIFLYHAMALIAIGSRTVSMRRTAAGCLLLSLLVIARYVDLFDSLLVRGIIFFLTGGAIFGAGSFYTSAKKRKGKAS